jgi:putative SOS response-associated peptidase YedK
MCFNVSVAKDGRELEERFSASMDAKRPFAPVYHASAFSYPFLPVVTNERPDRIGLLQWGLIPRWAKDEKAAEKLRAMTANARAEGLRDKPSFREPIESGRCLALVDGFYEWREVAGRKYPYHVRMPGGAPFALAGVWDSWRGKEGPVDTFAIITTPANPLMEKIHNTKKRMPAILRRGDERRWLGKLARAEVDALLAPFAGELEARTVSRLITARGEDSNVPAVMEPFEYRELRGEQAKLV